MARRGRQVAEAFISVYGDIKKFRDDLNTKGKAAAREVGNDMAKEMNKEFEKRSTADMSKALSNVYDALYSGDKLDWDRALGSFKYSGFDDMRKKWDDFFTEAGRRGAFKWEFDDGTAESQLKRARDNMRGLIDEQERSDKIQKIFNKDLGLTAVLTDELSSKAKAASTNFSALSKKAEADKLEQNFKKIVKYMDDMDYEGFGKMGKDSKKLSKAVSETIKYMREMNRVTDEEAALIKETISLAAEHEDIKRQAAKDEKARIKEQEALERQLKNMRESTLKLLKESRRRNHNEELLSNSILSQIEDVRTANSLEGIEKIREAHLNMMDEVAAMRKAEAEDAKLRAKEEQKEAS